MSNVQLGRTNKTERFYTERAEFMATLAKDIARFIRKAQKDNLTPMYPSEWYKRYPMGKLACYL